MNGLEQQYSALLDRELAEGKILWRSEHEAIKLKIADKCYITFDFWVLTAAGELEVRECKGGLFPEHNKVKTKTAAAMFPVRVVICRKKNKSTPWEYEEI